MLSNKSWHNPKRSCTIIASFTFLLGFIGLTVLPTEPAKACACCGTNKVIRVDKDDVLNVRTGPGTAYPVIAGLAPGDGCIIKTGKRRGRWVLITHGQIKGWVHSYYLGIVK